MLGNKRTREGVENNGKNDDFWDNSSNFDSNKSLHKYAGNSYEMPPVIPIGFGTEYPPCEHLDEMSKVSDNKYAFDEHKSEKTYTDYNEYYGYGTGRSNFPYDPRGQYDNISLNDVGNAWSTDESWKLDASHVTTSLFWGPDYVVNQTSIIDNKKETTDVPASHFSWLKGVLLGALQRKDVYNRGLFYAGDYEGSHSVVWSSKGSVNSTKLPAPWRAKLNEMDAIVLDADAVRTSNTIKKHEMDAWVQESENPSNSNERKAPAGSSKEISSVGDKPLSASLTNITKKNTSKFMKFLRNETAKFSGTDVNIATASTIVTTTATVKASSNSTQKLFVSTSATTPVPFTAHMKAAVARLEDDEDDEPERDRANKPHETMKEEVRRAPRRGEIGITPETIAEAEKAGYKVGGSANARRHQEAYKAKLLEQQANKDGLGNLEAMDKKKEDDAIDQLFDMLY